jgi:MFS family permease
VLYSLGAGYYQSVRAMLTAVTESQDRAVLYSVMMIVEIIATLIGAFLWPMVYGAGLQAGGFWVGMPFAAAAAILAFVYSTLAIVPSKEVVYEDE